MNRDDEARLERLEDRVAALERRDGTAGAAVGPRGGGADRPGADFWALDGLRERLADTDPAGLGAVTYAGTVRPDGDTVYEWQMSDVVDDLVADDVDAVERRAQSLAALGHPARLALVLAVLRGTGKTAELAQRADIGTSGQVYHHVRTLTAAGWLRPAGRGRLAVPPERTVPLLVALAVAS